MATKPTKLTDWATDGAALTTATTASRQTLGWQTLPDNLAGQPGEKPNLNQQNYWQLAVHEWSSYFEEETDEIREVITPTIITVQDLWEWEMPLLTTVRNNSGDLEIVSRGSTTVSGGNSRYNKGAEQEFLIIGHYMEATIDFNRSVGLQMIDGAAVVWDIVPVAGTTDIGWETFSMSGNTGVNSVDDDAILIVKPNAKIEIYKDGVLTADFSTFSILSSKVNIDAANTSGFRGVLRQLPTDLGYNYSGFGLTAPLKRKRYRPWVSPRFSNFNVIDEDQMDLPCKLDDGKFYKFGYDFRCDIGVNTALWVFNISGVDVSAGGHDPYIVDALNLLVTPGNSFSPNTLFTNQPNPIYGSTVMKTHPDAFDTTGLTLYLQNNTMLHDAMSFFSEDLSSFENIPWMLIGSISVEDV